jgi:hypothetical protein
LCTRCTKFQVRDIWPNVLLLFFLSPPLYSGCNGEVSGSHQKPLGPRQRRDNWRPQQQ